MAKAAENTNKNAKPGFVERCKNFFKGIGKSFKNMYHELKKVTWPTKKELINYSVVVFVFLIVMGVIFLAQFIFVTIGGDVLSVHALTATTWLVCAVIAFLVIPIDVVRKVIMNKQQ